MIMVFHMKSDTKDPKWPLENVAFLALLLHLVSIQLHSDFAILNRKNTTREEN